MKIALVGAWNTDSGSSVHAELVGRCWKERGVDLKVFSFYRHSFHGTALTKSPKEEEDFVTRCFTVYGIPTAEMNTKPLLEADFDILVVEDLGMIPMRYLLAIFPQIKKKARTVNIIHDGELSKKPEFFKFDWDHVVCFDERYYRFLKKGYPRKKLSIIPYPATPLQKGDMKQTREELGLPRDKKIVFTFGSAAGYSVDTCVVLDRLAEQYDITLLLVSEVPKVLKRFNQIKNRVKFELRIEERLPDMDLLYKYLQASDCMIYNKPPREIIVLGSTIYQCMGAGCPIITYDSNFVQMFKNEVLKYSNYYVLEDNIKDVFEHGPKYKKQQKALAEYLEENSAEPIADRFLELFDNLLKRE